MIDIPAFNDCGQKAPVQVRAASRGSNLRACSSFFYNFRYPFVFLKTLAMISIDKVGTVPPLKDRASYPFQEMDIGDSFLLTEYKKAESARIAALLFSKRKSLKWKFSVRKVSEGWRVFRVY